MVSEPPPQRWLRPKSTAPGVQKKLLPTRHLQLAARGDLPALKSLLWDYPRTLNRLGPHNRTLLWEATRKGRRKTVKYLVELGADVNIPARYNNECRVLISPYCAARYYKRDGIAEYLLTQGTKIDAFRAAFLGDRRRVFRRISADREMINGEDPWDRIYLMPLLGFAVAGGHEDLVEDLIKRGARIAPYSLQLLNLAGRVERIDLINLLVAHGADARCVDPGVLVDVTDLACFLRLLDLGAPVNGPGLSGYPPLAYVARGDKGARPDKVKLLLERGAEVNERGPNSRTALHVAAVAGSAEVLDLMLAHGGDATLKDDEGKTPADLAREARKQATLALLEGTAPTSG